MCQALEELMSDRIEMKVEEGRAEGRAEGREQSLVTSIKNLMKNLKLSAEQAMNSLGIPENEYKKYMAML